MPFQPSLSPKSAQMISHQFSKNSVRLDVPLLNLRLGIFDALVLQLQNTAAVNFAGDPDQGVGVFCLRRQAGEAKHRTKHPDSAKATIRIHQRKYSTRGHASILSDSPLVTIWAAKAGQRRSSYTVPGSGAVISQAASR